LEFYSSAGEMLIRILGTTDAFWHLFLVSSKKKKNNDVMSMQNGHQEGQLFKNVSRVEESGFQVVDHADEM